MPATKRGRPKSDVTTVAINIRVPQNIGAALHELAREDQRSVASMAAVLMREAMAARKARE